MAHTAGRTLTKPSPAGHGASGESALAVLGLRWAGACDPWRVDAVEPLGTVQVRDDAGGPVHVGGPRAQALLALLAVDAARVVPAVSLIDRLWDGDASDGARGALQSMISRLRGVLGAAIESHPAGYRLAVRRGQVDALAFEDLAGQGSRALANGDPARASAILRQALALWRGPALAGLLTTEPAAGIAARLEELRRSATADRIEADLAAAAESDAAALTAELRALIAEDPLAERPRALLMRTLYLAGRKADALAVDADARAQLAAQLGVDPSPQLERVYLGVLRRSLPEASPPEAREVGRGWLAGKQGPRRAPAGKPTICRRIQAIRAGVHHAARPADQPGGTRGPGGAGGGADRREQAGHADRPRRGGQDPARGRGGQPGGGPGLRRGTAGRPGLAQRSGRRAVRDAHRGRHPRGLLAGAGRRTRPGRRTRCIPRTRPVCPPGQRPARTIRPDRAR